MKKIHAIATAIALAATLGIVACTGQAATPESADTEGSAAIGMQMPNPWTEYTSVEDAAAAAGFDITVPDAIDGYERSLIQAMDGDTLEVRFTAGDDQVAIRKSVGTDDNSGVYETFETVTTENVNGTDVTVSSNGDAAYLATWTADGNAFSVYASAGMDLSALLDIVAAVA